MPGTACQLISEHRLVPPASAGSWRQARHWNDENAMLCDCPPRPSVCIRLPHLFVLPVLCLSSSLDFVLVFCAWLSLTYRFGRLTRALTRYFRLRLHESVSLASPPTSPFTPLPPNPKSACIIFHEFTDALQMASYFFFFNYYDLFR